MSLNMAFTNGFCSLRVSFVLLCFVVGVKPANVRLMPSEFPGLNLVQVYHNGQWGTVCPYQMANLSRVGQVVCRQLGYINVTSATHAWMLGRRMQAQYGNVHRWFAVKNCLGTESDIEKCDHFPWGSTPCYQVVDLLVRCIDCNVPYCHTGKSICNSNGTMCTECKPPYITDGWNKGCRRPTCVPTCKNNGTCIADNTCRCLAGYQGSLCELGGQLDKLLKPRLHIVEGNILSPLAWYDNPKISNNNMLCFAKISIQSSPPDTILTAESLNSVDELYGNYSMGPIDAKAEVNGTTRVACLQIRCPSFDRNGSEQFTMVRVKVSTSLGTCKIKQTTFKMPNTTVHSSTGKHDVLEFTLQPGNNYGPFFGIYISQGYREKAKYIAERSCFCGRDYRIDGIHPMKHTLANYVCT